MNRTGVKRMRDAVVLFLLAGLAASLPAACSDSGTGGADNGGGVSDAAQTDGAGGGDEGAADAGSVEPDSGQPPADAGTTDAGETDTGGGGPDAGTIQDFDFIDVHSHIFKTDQDVGEIAAFCAGSKVYRIILSGFIGTTPGPSCDDVVENAYNQHPELIIPFVRGFKLDDPASAGYVEGRLLNGPFKGVGELIVNGHGTNVMADQKDLMAVYKVAAKYEVPVNIHYTIGSDSQNEPGTPKHVETLENALNGNPGVTFILAHCGAGPAPHKTSYKDTLKRLLSNYANLYLDIAGMHIDLYDGGGNLTNLGGIILEVMGEYPERLLVGFDFDDDMFKYEDGASIAAKYVNLLSNLPPDKRRGIGIENAFGLLLGD